MAALLFSNFPYEHFEIFVRMFADEIFFIAKRSYEEDNENITFFEGKASFSRQIELIRLRKKRAKYGNFNIFMGIFR